MLCPPTDSLCLQDIHISMAISTAWKYLGYENGPWVKAHRAILADMGAFSVALTSCYDDLKKGQPLQAWRISNLQDWWAIFVRNVHVSISCSACHTRTHSLGVCVLTVPASLVISHLQQYHDQHQLIIVPELVKRGLVIPSHTYSQDPGHLRSLQAMTAQLYALVPNQCHATDLVTFKLLLVRYEALYSRMRDLLQQEEEAAMPLMQKEMPRKQWRMIEDQILKTSDKKTMGRCTHMEKHMTCTPTCA